MRKRGPRRLPRPANMERIIRILKKTADCELKKYIRKSGRLMAEHTSQQLATRDACETYMKEMGVPVDASRLLDLYEHYYNEHANKQHANKQRKHK